MKKLTVQQVFSRGVVLGPVFLVSEEEVQLASYAVATEEEKQEEKARFQSAVAKVSEGLAKLAENNPIFAGHFALVNDFMLHQSVEQKIEEGKNVEKAVDLAIRELEGLFASMEDAYMKERAADMTDIGAQLLAALQNRSLNKFDGLTSPSIIIARDLMPSDTANLDRDKVLGFITEEGGVTSHVAIMAKSLGIPALVGVSGILEAVSEKDHLIFDAGTGEIYINPDEEFAEDYRKRQERQAKEQAEFLAHATEPVVTEDGRKLKVYANVGSLEDIRQAIKVHCDGVGLFRTEFLYMENDHFPTEEEQYAVYKEAVETLGGELIIRTLDIGGDKSLTYYEFPTEENPFLGCRAIRLCLLKPEILLTQFRALLRAGVYGPIRIMLPMLISLDEAREARALYERAKEELRAEGKAFADDLQFGMMIETPASVFLAPEFAAQMDFFSIGTNDLTQYVLAVDRGNKAVAPLSSPFHPAVLRAIAQVIRAGHEEGIEVGMCGEFASNERATLLLLGLGLDEFSMASAETPRIKAMLRKANMEEAKKRAEEIIRLHDTGAVLAALDKWMAELKAGRDEE